jgi:pantoate--beta-alanine ligase
MIVKKTIAATMDQLDLYRQKGLNIGFVPTMGALHEGHLSLIRRARAENDIVVCSIFVNPIQFNNKEDLAKYPRTLEADTLLLESENCDLVFAPEVNEIYPNNNEPLPVYDLEGLDKPMEGQFRPGHFQGVCVIVHKLFSIVNPDRAYFGNKDFQQLAIIRNMVKKQKLSLEIVGCDIIREKDGLAKSSRNMRLTESERLVAPKIYQTLLQAKNKVADYKNTSFTPALLKQWIWDEISSNAPLMPEYVEIVNTNSLQSANDWNGGKALIVCVAIFDGSVRLIDNLVLFS